MEAAIGAMGYAPIPMTVVLHGDHGVALALTIVPPILVQIQPLWNWHLFLRSSPMETMEEEHVEVANAATGDATILKSVAVIGAGAEPVILTIVPPYFLVHFYLL